MKGFSDFKERLEGMKSTHIRAGITAMGLAALSIPAIGQEISLHSSYYKVTVDQKIVGYAETKKQADEAILEARARVNKKEDSLVMVAAECESAPAGRFVMKADDKNELAGKLYNKMSRNTVETRRTAYTVKVADKVVTVDRLEDVETALRTAAGKYDSEGQFEVQLNIDEKKGLNVMTADVVSADKTAKPARAVKQEADASGADGKSEEKSGASGAAIKEAADVKKAVKEKQDIKIKGEEADKDETVKREKAAEDKAPAAAAYDDNELVSMRFADNIQIIETTASPDQIGTAEEAAAQIQDELTVVTQKQVVYEEKYKEKVKYIDNDSWYTTKKEERQKPKDGVRQVTALVSYQDGKETARKVIGKTVVKKAVPKIVERGTKEPPTYIYPISGGRFSSGFGGRWGRQHKGIDLSTPIGTPVSAAREGTVSYSGTMNGYGYIVIIDHPDGSSTRYGHLSKCIAKVGQHVEQGDLIALSGNTGRSTGPHVHFEIRIGGVAVNPLDYL